MATGNRRDMANWDLENDQLYSPKRGMACGKWPERIEVGDIKIVEREDSPLLPQLKSLLLELEKTLEENIEQVNTSDIMGTVMAGETLAYSRIIKQIKCIVENHK